MNADKQRILIVEDSPEDAAVFARYLERDGGNFVCSIAQTGAAGLEALRAERFACVLLDHHLPDLNGLEFLEALGADRLPCAVVMLTGVGDEALAVAALRAGAEDYLGKSRLTREGLRKAVENATERFELRRQLERERHRSSAILESITDAFFATDTDWRFTYVNAAAERLTERSAAELLGQSVWGAFSWLEGTLFETKLREAMRTKTTTDFEVASTSHNRWLELRAYPSNESLSLYAADITDRKRDEERRKLLETVAVEASDAIIITDAEPLDEPGPRIIYVNPAFEAMTGYSAAEVIGKTPRILQGPDSGRAALDKIRQALQGWQAVEVEVVNYRKDGTPFWVELSIVPVADASGWYTHWVSVQRDTTERHKAQAALQQSQERLELGLEAASAGWWSWDVLSDDHRWSPGFEQLLGLEPGKYRGGMDAFLECVHPDDRQRIAGHLEQPLSDDVNEFEYRVPLPDGTLRWVASRSRLERDDAGKVVYAFGVDIDVTERRQVLERLREINEAQRRFVSDAAHELRTPLTSIMGNLKLLQRYTNIDPDEHSEMLGDASRETSRLSRLITDLLSLARGGMETHHRQEPVDLEVLIAEAMRDALHFAPDHRLTNAVDSHPDPRAFTVFGDTDRLKELVLILLENAAKYTPTPGTIAVSLRRAHEHVELRVSDTGPGIASEELERVFERFYRVDRARMRGPNPGGTGLGLPIARQIVQQHGGTIWLESELGVGTTAVVRFTKTGE